MNQWKIRFTTAAKDDLKQIGGYIAHNLHNPIAAKNLLSRMKKEIQSLTYLPERYEMLTEVSFQGIQLRRMVIGNYIVLYYAADASQTVFIYRIVYGGRDLTQISLDFEE